MKLFFTMLGVALLLATNLAQGQGGSDLLKQGQEVYENNCADCHRSNGEGLPVRFPALKGSAFVQGEAQPLINLILAGKKGMPAWAEHLKDQEMAAALTYIRNAWGNKAPAVTPEDVAAARKK